MTIKAGLFPGESILRFIHQSQHQKLLCHGINITTNQRLSPTFGGNRNTNIVSNSQTSPLPIFPEGVGMYVHRLKPQMWLPCRSVKSQSRPFYRYSGHIELIRFREYYRMPRGHEHISFVFSSAFRDIFS